MNFGWAVISPRVNRTTPAMRLHAWKVMEGCEAVFISSAAPARPSSAAVLSTVNAE